MRVLLKKNPPKMRDQSESANLPDQNVTFANKKEGNK